MLTLVVDTDEKRIARLKELQQPEFDRLMKQGDAMSKIVLQVKFGIDCDFVPGYDDGEKPNGVPGK